MPAMIKHKRIKRSKLNAQILKKCINRRIVNKGNFDLRIAVAISWGVFCGVIPIWGWQTIFAAFSSYILKLDKVIVIIFSNISIPPMVPFILYASMMTGAWVLNVENSFSVESVSYNSVKQSLCQYVVGSMVLAMILGVSMFALTMIVMGVCRRILIYFK